MSENKYKIAHDVITECIQEHPNWSAIKIHDYLEEKTKAKPMKQLFERFKDYLLDVGDELVSDEKKFFYLLNHFKEEFSGTNGLDDAITAFSEWQKMGPYPIDIAKQVTKDLIRFKQKQET